MPDNKYALIVAGGKGSRMDSQIPKQFMSLAGKPVLMRAIEAFYRFSPGMRIIVALPQAHFTFWNELCDRHGFDIPIQTVAGGATRFRSVKNALSQIDDDEGLVAVHDGVRPLISSELIAASFNIAAIHGSAVAAVRLKESIRIVDKDATRAVERSKYRLIQTPQTFRVSILKKAYEMEEDEGTTDDAGLVERIGVRISLFEGSYMNIKITTREDLIIAEQFLKFME